MIGLVESIRRGKARHHVFPRSLEKEEMIDFLESNGFIDLTGSRELESTGVDLVMYQMLSLGKCVDCYVRGSYDSTDTSRWIRFRGNGSPVYFVRTSDSTLKEFYVECSDPNKSGPLTEKEFYDRIEKDFGWK